MISSDRIDNLTDNGRRYRITLCPAHVNYSPYFVEAFTFEELHHVWPFLIRRSWFQSISKDDLVILEEETWMAGEGDSKAGERRNHAEICNDTRYEASLVGWEHLAGEAANYDY